MSNIIMGQDYNSNTLAKDHYDHSILISEFVSKVDLSTLSFPTIGPQLDQILGHVSTTGLIPVEWKLLTTLIAAKIVKVLYEFFDKYGFIGPITQSFESRLGDILLLLKRFDCAPFTIQRLVELIMEPKNQYKSTYKLMNGLERILSVTSTIDSSSEVMSINDTTEMEIDCNNTSHSNIACHDLSIVNFPDGSHF